MVKGTSLLIEEYKAAIIEVVNKSGMPTGVSKLVLGEVLNNVSKANDKVLALEKEEYEKSLKELNEGSK